MSIIIRLLELVIIVDFYDSFEVFLNCILCRLPLNLRWGCCSQCAKLITSSLPVYRVCGLPLFSDSKQCYFCTDFKPQWHRLVACNDYLYPFTKLIYQFKAQYKTELSYGLSRLLFLIWYQARSASGLIKPDIVICVPLSKIRYWTRGFNQSELLAKPIAYWLGADFQPNLILRNNKYSIDKKRLSKAQRAINISRVFSCHTGLTGKTIAVIDDIVTTGCTVNEISKQLKQQGALHIQVLCLCRTRL